MRLLYVDMSGNVGQAEETHFIMAGVAVHEIGIHHVIKELDDVIKRHFPDRDPAEIELHGSPIWGGRGFWRKVEPERRVEIIKDALSVFRGPSRANLRAFGMVVEKAVVSPDDPVEHAYEQMCTRFDKYLRRIYNRRRERQRGLIVVDKSRYEDTLQGLAHSYREDGTRWGSLRNLSEVPLFVDSRMSRLIQLADLVSFALWKKFEHGKMDLMLEIVDSFDREGRVYHGLYHKRDPGRRCDCAACASRR